MKRALFGPPAGVLKRGGTRITVYVVPTLEGHLVAYDLSGDPAVAGRWLPWDVLPFAESPHAAASAVIDRWCGAPMLDLRLVDSLSLDHSDGTWELALIFRAELAAAPEPSPGLAPIHLPLDALDGVAPFAPGDLHRWLTSGEPPPPAAAPSDRPAIF